MSRFKLPPSQYKKLCALVRERDITLSYDYFFYLKEPAPVEGGDFHHIIHRASFGPDKEENLILLHPYTHRFVVHGNSWEASAEMCARIHSYMSCKRVQKWRSEHQAELEKIYATEEGYQWKKRQQSRERAGKPKRKWPKRPWPKRKWPKRRP